MIYTVCIGYRYVNFARWAESQWLVENVSIFVIFSQFVLHFTLSVHRAWEFLSAKFHLKIYIISFVLDKGKSIRFLEEKWDSIKDIHYFREKMRFHLNALFKKSNWEK